MNLGEIIRDVLRNNKLLNDADRKSNPHEFILKSVYFVYHFWLCSIVHKAVGIEGRLDPLPTLATY